MYVRVIVNGYPYLHTDGLDSTAPADLESLTQFDKYANEHIVMYCGYGCVSMCVTTLF
jgi:hypothetical protein